MPRKIRNNTTNVRKAPIRLPNSHASLIGDLTTLSNYFVSKDKLYIAFDIADKNDNSYLESFIHFNETNLKFLGIHCSLSTDPSKPGITIHTSRYAGAIPLRSPFNGKYDLDLKVKGSYSSGISDDELYDILLEMKSTMMLEFHPSLSLTSNSVKPPLYFECEKFVDLFEESGIANWNRFTTETRIEPTPRASTNWTRHAVLSFNPKEALRFENRINALTPDHKERHQLNDVLRVCEKVIGNVNTPLHARREYGNKIKRLLANPLTTKYEHATHFIIHTVDPLPIKKLKQTANTILIDSSSQKRSWRVDIAELFERYVQYLFRKAFSSRGWQIFCNPHYPIQGPSANWTLRYLEPDLIVRFNNCQIIVDAKYKSHLLNSSSSDGEEIKSSFREDLHQVLAYSTFNEMSRKIIIIAYPTTTESHEMKLHIQSPFSSVNADVHLLALPLSLRGIRESIEMLKTLFE